MIDIAPLIVCGAVDEQDRVGAPNLNTPQSSVKEQKSQNANPPTEKDDSFIQSFTLSCFRIKLMQKALQEMANYRKNISQSSKIYSNFGSTNMLGQKLRKLDSSIGPFFMSMGKWAISSPLTKDKLL